MTRLFQVFIELLYNLFIAPFLKLEHDEAIRDSEAFELDEGEEDDDRPWQGGAITIPDMVLPPVDEKPPEPEPEPTPDPEPAVVIEFPSRMEAVEIVEPGRMLTGVWCGTAALGNPEKAVKFCLAHNIGRLDVIINDHSAWRDPQDFTMWNEERIRRLVTHAKEMGLEVHFMSWVMPHEQYIETAAGILVPLCNDLGVKSLQWDAEEPWTQARNRMRYTDAAKRIADSFSGLECEMGVNGIGYTPVSKFGPLAEVCDYVVPQCYSTISSGISPQTVVPRLVRRWEKVFGKQRMSIGLAAYRQSGIEGHTVESALRTAYAGAEALENVDSVIYWSLRWLEKNKTVARVIRDLSKPEGKPESKILVA